MNAEFVVFRSSDLTTVQNGYRLVDALGMWLPFICIALAALGIFVARNHRLAFLGAGLGLAAAMVVTGIGLALARRAYLDGVPPDVLPAEAATAIFDTLVRFLRDSIRAAFLIGLLTALVAFLSGPSVTAVTFRRWSTAGLAYAKGGIESLGLDLTRPTGWVAPQARVLRAAVFVVGFVVLLAERYRPPTSCCGWRPGCCSGSRSSSSWRRNPVRVPRPAAGAATPRRWGRFRSRLRRDRRPGGGRGAGRSAPASARAGGVRRRRRSVAVVERPLAGWTSTASVCQPPRPPWHPTSSSYAATSSVPGSIGLLMTRSPTFASVSWRRTSSTAAGRSRQAGRCPRPGRGELRGCPAAPRTTEPTSPVRTTTHPTPGCAVEAGDAGRGWSSWISSSVIRPGRRAK